VIFDEMLVHHNIAIDLDYVITCGVNNCHIEDTAFSETFIRLPYMNDWNVAFLTVYIYNLMSFYRGTVIADYDFIGCTALL